MRVGAAFVSETNFRAAGGVRHGWSFETGGEAGLRVYVLSEVRPTAGFR